MKVMILTCHTPFNYGAVLQCYALERYLADQGVSVEVIDYHTPESKNRNWFVQMAIHIVRSPDYIKCRKIFGGFIKKYIPVTERRYTTSEELMKYCPAADLYIAGSDQIWNPELPNGKGDIFFLGFVTEARKISYAASMGIDSIPEEEKERFIRLLESFQAISVREISGEKALREIGIKAETVLDPVFLLTRRRWREFLQEDSFRKKERYVLVYSLRRQEELYVYARILAKKHGYKVYTISNLWSDVRFDHDKFFWNPDIKRFLALLRHADHVVTNSFHGLCYSIIFKKPMHMFQHREASNLRMIDLMEMLGLSDRWVTTEKVKMLDGNINYQEVYDKLKVEKRKSMNFIKKNLFIRDK